MLQCFVLHIQQARYLVNKSGSDFPRNILHEINDIISHERNYKDTKHIFVKLMLYLYQFIIYYVKF